MKLESNSHPLAQQGRGSASRGRSCQPAAPARDLSLLALLAGKSRICLSFHRAFQFREFIPNALNIGKRLGGTERGDEQSALLGRPRRVRRQLLPQAAQVKALACSRSPTVRGQKL